MYNLCDRIAFYQASCSLSSKLLKNIYKVFNKINIKKFFAIGTFFNLILCNTMAIIIRIICMHLGLNPPIKSLFLYIISVSLSSVMRSYVNIVIESTYNSKSEIEKIPDNKYISKFFTRKNIFKLIINFFINITVMSSFMYIDNGFNCVLVFFVFSIEMYVIFIKPYINEDFLHFFNITIPKYSHDLFILKTSVYHYGTTIIRVPEQAHPLH